MDLSNSFLFEIPDHQNNQLDFLMEDGETTDVIHVRKACAACKLSHSRCSTTRPCNRCVKKGIECVEQPAEQKKSFKKSKKRKVDVDADEKMREMKDNQQDLLDKVGSLAETTQQQSVILSKLLKQLNTNAVEILNLRNQLQTQSYMLQKLMADDKYNIGNQQITIDQGEWASWKDSDRIGIAIFQQGSNLLVASNKCFAEKINKLNIGDLVGKHISAFNASPQLFALLGDRTPRDIPFSCNYQSILHIKPDIYWLEIDSEKENVHHQ